MSLLRVMQQMESMPCLLRVFSLPPHWGPAAALQGCPQQTESGLSLQHCPRWRVPAEREKTTHWITKPNYIADSKLFKLKVLFLKSQSNFTHVLQGVRGHTLWQGQAIDPSYHHQYIRPGTLEQRTSLKAWPGQILYKGTCIIKARLE